MLAGTIRNTLAVVPASVVENWFNEANTWLKPIIPKVSIFILSSTKNAYKRRRAIALKALKWYTTVNKKTDTSTQNPNLTPFFFCHDIQ